MSDFESKLAVLTSAENVDKSLFSGLPGYPWLDPCPRCGFRGSCDCTVLERARAAHPNLIITGTKQ